MSTGRKTLRQNTRERVISPDFNRAQTFGQADANDILATQVIQRVDDLLYAGVTFPPGTTPGGTAAIFQDTVTTPLYGSVLEGLMVIVPTAATSIIITPGLALLVDPDGQAGSSNPLPPNPDDSVTKLVRGSGVALGALPWTPNGGGGIRIDVVEMQRADVVTETDNRDIFNPSTGLFTAQSVAKVTIGEVSYRINLGTSGGGLPAPSLGWMPLAVLATPVGAVDLDAVEAWDVRNLSTDAAVPGAMRFTTQVQTEMCQGVLINNAVVGSLPLSGFIVRSAFGYRFGGLLLDLDTLSPIDLLLAKFREPGFAAIPSSPYFVYAAMPDGYVRWVRYYKTPAATVGGRVPGPFRGLPVVSMTAAVHGLAASPIAIPTSWGILGSASTGVLVASGAVSTASVLLGSVSDGDLTSVQVYGAAATPWKTHTGTIAGLTSEWTLVPGSDYPVGSKKMRGVLVLGFPSVGAAGSSFLAALTVGLYDSVANLFNVIFHLESMTVIESASVPQITITIDIPLTGDATLPNPLVLRAEVVTLAGSVAAPVAINVANFVPSAWNDGAAS